MRAEPRSPDWGTAWLPDRGAGRNPLSGPVATGAGPRDGPRGDVGDQAGAGDLVSCDTMLPRS
jgi:hypothetical protein